MIFATVQSTFQWHILNSFSFINVKLVLNGFISVLWLYWIWSRRHLYRFAWSFPGAFGLPFIGIIHYGRKIDDMIPVVKNLFSIYKTYTLHLWLGIRPIILSADPYFVEKILTSTELLNKAQIYKVLEEIGGVGLVSISSNSWQFHRKKINPSFNHSALLSFFPIFHSAKNNFLKKIELYANEQKFIGLTNLFLQTSMRISMETIMGITLIENNAFDESFVENFDIIIRQSTFKGLLSFLKLDFLYILNRKYSKAQQILKKWLIEQVNDKIVKLNAEKDFSKIILHNNNNNIDKDSIKKKPQIVVDQILRTYQSNEYTFDEVIGEISQTLAASFETSAQNMFFTLVLIAMHPDIQENLYEELANVFPNENICMQYEHIKQLPYLEMIIKESLRLCPNVPVIGRRVEQDTKLSDDLTLPKNIEIVISLYHLHRRTDIWGPNAEKFDPDNFLPDNERARHKFAYIPFSAGLRNCIGWRYALFLVSYMTAAIVRSYKLECDMKYEEIEYNLNMSLKYKREPLIKFTKRF